VFLVIYHIILKIQTPHETCRVLSERVYLQPCPCGPFSIRASRAPTCAPCGWLPLPGLLPLRWLMWYDDNYTYNQFLNNQINLFVFSISKHANYMPKFSIKFKILMEIGKNRPQCSMRALKFEVFELFPLNCSIHL
jgi:hypothetical protein